MHWLPPLPKLERTNATDLEAGEKGFSTGSGHATERTPFLSALAMLEWGWEGAPSTSPGHKAASCPHPGLAIWMPISALPSPQPSSPPQPSTFSSHWLQPLLPSHATIFCLPCLLRPQPPAPNQRELRNSLLAQEQLLSNCFLIVCTEGNWAQPWPQ